MLRQTKKELIGLGGNDRRAGRKAQCPVDLSAVHAIELFVKVVS